MKTTEQKREYLKKWRLEHREEYLAKKRSLYQSNKEQYRDAAKVRAAKYYYEVELPKRKANPELYRARDREHSQKRLESRRIHLRELRERMGGKCSFCNYKIEIDILQFHHLGGKDRNVTDMQSFNKREAEAEKCILLCPNCHAIETLKALRK